MSPTEYDTLMTKLLDIVLQKTYDDELEWVSSIGTDGSIKYETTLMPQEIAITCVLTESNKQFEQYYCDIFITIDKVCTRISWFKCDTVQNSNSRAKAAELKFALLNNSKDFVLNKLRKMII